MILSGKAIEELIQSGQLKVRPAAETKEVSIKIHLSGSFGKERESLKEVESYELKPKEFILGTSLESFEFPSNYAGLYDNHIHMAREGIFTHLGSMLIEPGFSGQFLLEIFNSSDKPMKLEKGMRVGNLMILKVLCQII